MIIYWLASENKSKETNNNNPNGSENSRWYQDEDINTLFANLFATDEKNTFIAPSQLGGATGNHENLLENILFNSTFNPSNKNIFIPLNIGARATSGRGTSGNHWTLGYFQFAENKLQKIFYFDSLGDGPGKLFKNIAKCIKEIFKIEKLEITNLSQELQKDGYNCGPWTVKAAKILKDAADEQLFQTQIQYVNIQNERNKNQMYLNQNKQT